jgi:endonuclease YncB( thermonuclease family)
MERGKYFRIAADLIVDGENLADILIEAGIAVRYDGFVIPLWEISIQTVRLRLWTRLS